MENNSQNCVGKRIQNNPVDDSCGFDFFILPCKIGDPVFVKMYGGVIVEEKVSRIIITARNIIIGYYEHYGHENNWRLPLRTRTLGKDCFLKREEVK